MRAWVVPGRKPLEHYKQIWRLAEEWPALYKALTQLVAVSKLAKEPEQLKPVQSTLGDPGHAGRVHRSTGGF